MAKRKAQQAIDFVEKLALDCESATELHNAFFGNGGKFGQLYPTRQEREAFLRTPEYEKIVEIRDALENPAARLSVKAKAQEALDFVRGIAPRCESERDLHNAFFGIGAKYGQLFPTRAERELFRLTPEYKEIVKIRTAAGRRKRRTPAKR
jgi:hypothetical protein